MAMHAPTDLDQMELWAEALGPMPSALRTAPTNADDEAAPGDSDEDADEDDDEFDDDDEGDDDAEEEEDSETA
jgi:hypothetical protein